MVEGVVRLANGGGAGGLQVTLNSSPDFRAAAPVRDG